MSRDFSRITVVRLVRKNSFKRQQSKKRNTHQHRHGRICQSNLKNSRFSHSELSLNTTAMINSSKRNKINDEEQRKPIVIVENEGNNQLNLSYSSRDFLSNNSIKTSTTCFHMSTNHRISPGNFQDVFKNDLKLDGDRRNRKKKKYISALCKFGICFLVLLVLIGAMIGVLVYLINRSKSSTTAETTTLSSIVTTTQNAACTTGGVTCSTPMFFENRTGNCGSPSSVSYVRYTCCYQAISTQLTIEYQLINQRDHWSIDDVSITQGNGELLINGGFESNFTGWRISLTNLPTSPITDSLGTPHSGSAYLYSGPTSTSDSIEQTINVTQGQNVNISFWWIMYGGSGSPGDRCEGTVTLTP